MCNRIGKVNLKHELAVFWGKLRSIWYFGNETTFDCSEKFRLKSTFNPKKARALIWNLFNFLMRETSRYRYSER